MRASEVAAQRYLRTNASVLEWFAVAVHFTARESGLLLATCVALYAGRWSWALRALLAMSLGEMLNGLLKFATHEPRPVWREDVAQSPFAHARRTWEDDYSFPSSHAQVMLGLAVSFQHLVPDVPRAALPPRRRCGLARRARLCRPVLARHRRAPHRARPGRRRRRCVPVLLPAPPRTRQVCRSSFTCHGCCAPAFTFVLL